MIVSEDIFMVHSFLKRQAFFMQMEYTMQRREQRNVIVIHNTIFQLLRTKLNSTTYVICMLGRGRHWLVCSFVILQY